MSKTAIILLALVAIAAATPIGLLGGGVISKNHHVTSSVISPYLGMGLGYGMMGYPGLGMGMGHSISSHSIGHHMGHLGGIGMGGIGHMGMAGIGHMGHMGGLGMKGLYGMYPGGIGLGYGLMG